MISCHGKLLNSIKEAIMENTIVYDKIDEVQSKVEYNGGALTP